MYGDIMNWIDFSITKPETGQECLIKSTIYGIHQAAFNGNSFDFNISGSFYTLDALAWIPIEGAQ